MSAFENPVIRAYALASTIIALQLILLGTWTGGVRALRKLYVNPEDAPTFRGEAAEADAADVLRAKRAHQNAIESALPFFTIGYLYIGTNPTRGGAEIYFTTFVVARILHSIFYLSGRQPFRTISYAVGIAAIVGMAVRVLRYAI